MVLQEPFGTAPLPVLSASSLPLKLTFDPLQLEVENNGTPQQPQTVQIAVFDATPNAECINGASVVAVNQHFICYAVKQGLIRILHRNSTMRSLLRAHAGQRVTDIQFLQDGDVLATVGSNDVNSSKQKQGSMTSRIVIWRVFERSPEIMSEKLLEIETDKFSISRVLWHPFNPNKFWMVHRDHLDQNVATLVETTHMDTVKHPKEQHALCSFFHDFCIMKDALQLKPSTSSASNIVDLCWNGRDPRYVMSVFDSNRIVLWDLNEKKILIDGLQEDPVLQTVTPLLVGEVVDATLGGLSRCKFLPHEDTELKSGSNTTTLTTCFVTGAKDNSSFTLWSAWLANGALPTKLQTINVAGSVKPPSALPSTYILDVCFGPAPPDASPPSCFVLLADRQVGRLFAFHCLAQWSTSNETDKKALFAGCDYVVPFKTKYPIYSWSVVCAPTQDISDEELSEQGGLMFDMKLFSYQSTVVQCLTLTSYMCLPPSSSWTDPTPGVLVERAPDKIAPSSASDFESDEEFLYDEDYDIADDEDEEDYDDAPEASALPLPDGVSLTDSTGSSSLSQNPFANWLGAIAAKNAIQKPSLPPHSLSNETAIIPPAPATQTSVAATPALLDPPSVTAGQAPPSINLSQPFLSPQDILADQHMTPVLPTTKLSVDPSEVKSKQDLLTSRDPTPTATNRQPPQSQKPSVTEKPSVGGKDKTTQKKATKQTPTKTQETKISILKRDAVDPPRDRSGTITESQETLVPSQGPVTFDDDTIRKIIREELLQTVIPTIHQTIVDALPQRDTQVNGNYSASIARSIEPLQKSIDAITNQRIVVDTNAIANTLSDSVHEPIQVAFADITKNVIIPSLNALSCEVLSKVSEHLEKVGTWHQKDGLATSNDMDSMSKQLSTMTQLVAKLTDEVQSLRREVSTALTQNTMASTGNTMSAAAAQPKQVSPVDPLQTLRHEILELIRERKYEPAFTKAISSSSIDIVLLCCSNTDLNDVLGGNSPALSQAILLCLMQQLGTLVSANISNLPLVMDWLQEITLYVNPLDASISRHVPGVCQQVMQHITHKLQTLQVQGPDQNQLRRQLQRMIQLIRGISVGSHTS